MQHISVLKTITDILFILFLIPVIFGIPFIIMYTVVPDMIPFDVSVKNEDLQMASHNERILFLILTYIVYIIDVYALYIFREIMKLFTKKIFFSERISAGFSLIGKLIITSYILYITGSFFLRMFTIQRLSFEIDLSIFYALGIGYFFIVLGSIFKKAKEIKEENELTI